MARPLSVTAEVVGTGSDGTEPSLLLSVRRHGVYSDDSAVVARLLFNCGEGTQRLCGENGVKLRSLDTVFLTRFDPQVRRVKAEGLTSGTYARFVRRKFPQIECVRVTSGGGDAQHVADAADGVVQREDWLSGQQLDIDHVRVVAVILQPCVHGGRDRDASNMVSDSTACSFCAGDGPKEPKVSGSVEEKASIPSQTVTTGGSAANSTVAGLSKHRGGQGDRETARMRKWLVRFYSIQEPSKIPYIDVILSRYRGRHEELKAQLVGKYGGDLASGAAEAEDTRTVAGEASCIAGEHSTQDHSSSSSSNEDSDDNDSRMDEERTDKSAVLDRRWLLQFYRQHQPDKLPYVDKVLKQFQGREETLKRMLLQKYGTCNDVGVEDQPPPAPLKSESVSSLEPQKKKQKTSEGAKTSSDSDPATPVPIAVVTDNNGDAIATTDASANRGEAISICYALWFHELPLLHSIVWIIDCQSTLQIPNLLDQFSRRDAACPHQPALIVHFTPANVRRDPRYIKWMADISLGTSQDNQGSEPCPEHLIFDGELLQSAADGVFSFSFLASAKATIRRRGAGEFDAVNAESPLHINLGTPKGQMRSPLKLDRLADFLKATKVLPPHQRQRQIVWHHDTSQASGHIAQSKLTFVIVNQRTGRRGFDYDRTGWASYSVDADGEAAGSTEAADAIAVSPPSTALSIAQGHDGQLRSDEASGLRKLIVLGTGSAAPSKLRASSSIYVELGCAVAGAVPSLLLDCGEGTYGQLWRQFGPSTPARVGGIRCIWISHHHADHQCGLVRILHEYCRHTAAAATTAAPSDMALPELVLVAPQSVLAYVSHWTPFLLAQHGPIARRIVTATCREFNEQSHPVRCRLLGELGFAIADMYSVPVRHCYDAYGLVVTSRSGRKLVYSGDTQPCDRLVRAGMGAALLIHEATFDDSMEQDAAAKRHSTVSQALDVARRMQAAHVILTHFSQRYPSLPPSGSGLSSGESNRAHSGSTEPHVDCAFDGFELSGEIW